MQLIDTYGRTITSLRISLTSRCNLKCIYCHHEGETREITNEMNVETIANIVKASTAFGVNKVKFSGGEPLMREDLEQILRVLPRLKDVSATTNGTYLAKKAHTLADSGLDRINISLPSLYPDIYKQITGGDVHRVFEGIDAAVECDLTPVKLNMVLLKGINDSELPEMMNYIRKYDGKVILQLIELMDFNEMKQYQININEMEKYLESRASNIETRSMHRRKKFHIDGIEVELVRPIDNSHFCANCTRLRITSDGMLKPCLLRNDNLVDVKNMGTEDIMRLMKTVMEKREPFYKS